MEIPYHMLSQQALRGVVEEFITREGTDYGPRIYQLEEKIAQVMAQLRAGTVRCEFDPASETCTIVACDVRPDIPRDVARDQDT
jgi:uncharacterized protein